MTIQVRETIYLAFLTVLGCVCGFFLLMGALPMLGGN